MCAVPYDSYVIDCVHKTCSSVRDCECIMLHVIAEQS